MNQKLLLNFIYFILILAVDFVFHDKLHMMGGQNRAPYKGWEQADNSPEIYEFELGTMEDLTFCLVVFSDNDFRGKRSTLFCVYVFVFKYYKHFVKMMLIANILM